MAAQFWKCGSRWGNAGTRVLDLFLDYGCVFFGSRDESGVGAWRSVEPGDYIIVSDGSTPVALARASSPFMPYENSSFRFPGVVEDDLWMRDEHVAICPVSIHLLSPKACEDLTGFDTRKRFCRVGWDVLQRKMVDVWDSLERAKRQGEFDIQSAKWMLVSVDGKPAVPGAFSDNIRYRVPVYQRPYSWGELELNRLVEDLKQACDNGEPVFMGTIQLSQPTSLDSQGLVVYDLIDGQQRLTTFMLLWLFLCKRLRKKCEFDFPRNFHTSVNRGTAQRDMDELHQYLADLWEPGPDHVNRYIENYQLLEKLVDAASGKDDKAGASDDELLKLWDYLRTKVCFIVIETHAGLSKTLKIFNTINTAGMDLGVEDLFKIRFYEYCHLSRQVDGVFDEISALYAAVDEHNRSNSPHLRFNMHQVLAACQKILVAKCKLGMDAFYMGIDRFYGRFFDTVLGIHTWPEFESCRNEKELLTVEDVSRVIQCFIDRAKLLDESYYFRNVSALLQRTRYGYAGDFNIVALYFERTTLEELTGFTEALMKKLVPASLFYRRSVYDQHSRLFSWLKEAEPLSSPVAEEDFEKVFTWDIVGNLTQKYLMCMLIEFVLRRGDADQKALYKALFQQPIDIEHIQCATDENDPQGVIDTWGDVLNSIGNLTLMDRSANRSINNQADKKAGFYIKSHYVSTKELTGVVGGWKKEHAEARQNWARDLLCGYLYRGVSGKPEVFLSTFANFPG